MKGSTEPSQRLALGDLEAAVSERLEVWRADATIERMWAGDHTVWVPDDRPEITNRLGWLRLPTAMRAHIEEITAFAAGIADEGFRQVVLLGMGGSSLAPEVFAETFGSAPGYPDLMVLDSTHPASVESLLSEIDASTTLFLVASKSGTTIEPLSFFEFFWAFASDGVDDPGAHFVAITDPGSSLADLAAERSFRHVFVADPDVGGRYSALTHFGLVPAALIGAELSLMLDAAGAMAVASAPGVDPADSPGAVLGAVLGEAALAGRDKVTFLVSPALAAFPAWAEQLIAESTGKDGVGIVPIAGEAAGDPAAYGSDRLFVHLALVGEGDPHARAVAALESAGHPVVSITVPDRSALAAEMYRAEIATALAGAVLGIHPFDQPDVQRAKELAREAMSGDSVGEPIPEVAADGPGTLHPAVASLLSTAHPGDYVAFQAFIEPTTAAETALDAARLVIRDRLRVATTVGFGPRFLHSTGQLHKGGADTGIFIQIVDHAAPDLAVPGAGFTFGGLVAGQADGDFGALVGAGRRVIRICLGDDVAGGLANLVEAVRG